MLSQFLINGLITGLLYSVVALGFSLIYNTTRIFHVAYAGIYVVSAYLCYFLIVKVEAPFILAATGALSGAALISLGIEKLVYGPLSQKKSSLNVILISSIGVMVVLINTVAMLFGNETKIFNADISPALQWGDLLVTRSQLWQAGVSVLAIIATLLFLTCTGAGVRARAIRDDPELSRVFGIDLYKNRALLFLLSGALAAIPSCLIAYDVGMDPYVGMPILLNAIVAIIVGGTGNFGAAVPGGIIIGLLQALSVYFFEAKWESAVTFLLLILFLLVRPQGILGEQRRTA